MLETSLDKLYKLLEVVYEDLDKTKEMISKLQLEARKEALKDVPGLEGVFDGKYLISDTGEKLEVPANYAAKSRIVFGDRLKAYEDEGKQMFKQLEKVSRKKVPAVISKKEGKFFALTEFGSHEISAIAVEFNHVSVNDKIQVILPETNTKAPYAALDKILEQKEGAAPVNSVVSTITPVVKKEAKPVQKVEQVLDINKEFVMDLSASAPVTPSVPVVVPTIATVPAQVVSQAPVPVVQKTIQVSAPRQENNSRSEQPAKRSPARKPSASNNRRPASNNAPQQNRPSDAPRYPSRSNNNNAPLNNNRDSVSDLKPNTQAPAQPTPKFILEDDDLR